MKGVLVFVCGVTYGLCASAALDDVRPRHTTLDAADRGLSTSHGLRNIDLTFASQQAFANLTNNVFAELARSDAVTPKHALGGLTCPVRIAAVSELVRPRTRPRGYYAPTLRIHVAHVVCVRADEEMARPHAARVVAVMAYVEALGDGPPKHLVHDPVDVAHRATVTDLRIPVIVSRAGPFPAPVADDQAPHDALVDWCSPEPAWSTPDARRGDELRLADRRFVAAVTSTHPSLHAPAITRRLIDNRPATDAETYHAIL